MWEAASGKYAVEYADLLAAAASQTLLDVETLVLSPLLAHRPDVVHLQSGHGVDDHALLRAGARTVLGVDYSAVAATSAQRRADDLRVRCRYVVAAIPPVPLQAQCADLVYTGKGALIWIEDLTAWAREVVRLLRSGGHLYLYEAHPMVPLWAWDEDEARIRPDRSYFADSHVNDTFPGRGAVESQHTLSGIVTSLLMAGLQIVHFAEYPEPFWRPAGTNAAAWQGPLPNSFSILARRAAPDMEDCSGR